MDSALESSGRETDAEDRRDWSKGMAKTGFGLEMIAKSALLWLTAGLVFASLFGALLSASADRSSVSFSQTAPDPVVAVHEAKAAH